MPVLGVQSIVDVARTEDRMTGSTAYIRAAWRYVRLPGVGHRLQIERSDGINRLLLEWFGSPTAARSDRDGTRAERSS